jgi:uncharacterized protein (DUF433 family)
VFRPQFVRFWATGDFFDSLFAELFARLTRKKLRSINDIGNVMYMNSEWDSCPDVERIPGKFSGEWVFKGTRVPVKALFENIEDGASIDDFLEWFPGVTRHQVESVLERASASLLVESPA